MKYPKCNQEMEVHLKEYKEFDVFYEELSFHCPNGHEYFVRVHKEDLIEEINK